MQRIVQLKWSPKEYAEGGLERTMGRPAECPNCRKSLTLEAHGYYWRWVSLIGVTSGAIQIRIRRFFVAVAGAL